MVDQRQQAGGGENGDIAGPGRLAALGNGADQAALAGAGVDGRRQDAGDRRQRSVEGQLAERRVAGDLVRRHHPLAASRPKRDGQVEVAALLGQIGGRQVDRDALGRQGQAYGGQGGAHPLAALGDRLVGQADDGEGRQSGRHLHLDVDVEDLNAVEGHRVDARDHGPIVGGAGGGCQPPLAGPRLWAGQGRRGCLHDGNRSVGFIRVTRNGGAPGGSTFHQKTAVARAPDRGPRYARRRGSEKARRALGRRGHILQNRPGAVHGRRLFRPARLVARQRKKKYSSI